MLCLTELHITPTGYRSFHHLHTINTQINRIKYFKPLLVPFAITHHTLNLTLLSANSQFPSNKYNLKLMVHTKKTYLFYHRQHK